MNSPARETALRVLLPSLAIAVGYGLFMAPVDERTKLQGKVAEARLRAPRSPRDSGKTSAKVRALETQRSELQRRLERLRGGADDHARMSALRDVVEAFAAHDVLLLDEVEGGGEGFQLPHALGRLPLLTRPNAKRGQPAPPAPARHLSQLRLRGSYFALLHTLEELAGDSDSAALVVGVDLDLLDPSGQHLWTVVVWV